LEVSRELALLARQAAEELKAENVLLLELKGLTVVADYFLVCGGDSSRQVKAIADHIDDTLTQAGLRLLHREGMGNAKWVLLDFGGIVCHIFSRADRDFYGLDRFWGDAPRIWSMSSDGGAPGREKVASSAAATERRGRRPQAGESLRP
jgi:ribosome-associated protein